MTFTTAVYSENFWWWTEELPETRSFYSKNKFEKLMHLVDCIIIIWNSVNNFLECSAAQGDYFVDNTNR